LEEGINLI